MKARKLVRRGILRGLLSHRNMLTTLMVDLSSGGRRPLIKQRKNRGRTVVYDRQLDLR